MDDNLRQQAREFIKRIADCPKEGEEDEHGVPYECDLLSDHDCLMQFIDEARKLAKDITEGR